MRRVRAALELFAPVVLVIGVALFGFLLYLGLRNDLFSGHS